MKCIKYLAMVLFAGALMTSCVTEPVNVGTTTVEFADATYKAGFGGGTIYVPIAINGENAAAMNTSDVNVKIKVDETHTNGDITIGKADEDFMITSYDLVFRNNYEIPEESKDLPYEKTVGVEIKILNTEPEVMEFKLAIESSNTTIGAQTECLVRLEKTETDRLCGTYTLVSDKPCLFTSGPESASFSGINVGWSAEDSCFEVYPFGGWDYTPVYIYWDSETKEMYMHPYEGLIWYTQGSQLCYQMFVTVQDGSVVPYNDVVFLDYDLDAGTIKFPDNLYFGIMVYDCDPNTLAPISMLGYMEPPHPGFVMTKQK